MNHDLLQPLAAPVASLIDELVSTRSKLTELESQGLSPMRPAWYRGKYLYLVAPKGADGRRIRQYVGIDPERQRVALALVERSQAHQRLAGRVRLLEEYLAVLSSGVQKLGREVAGWLEALREGREDELH